MCPLLVCLLICTHLTDRVPSPCLAAAEVAAQYCPLTGLVVLFGLVLLVLILLHVVHFNLHYSWWMVSITGPVIHAKK